MDTGRIRRELVSSFSLVVTAERWLLAGVPLAAVVYAVWVGATGAAIAQLTEFAGTPVTVAPWSGTTTAVAGVAGLLWVAVPAAVGTFLVRDRLTNHHDNLKHGYRLQHPASLLVAPAALLLVGVGALLGAGEAAVPVLALVVAGAVFLLLRTVAYAYRVFALSVPLVPLLALFFTLSLLGTSLIAGAAVAAGRAGLLADAAAGLGGATGLPLPAVLTGTTELGGVPVPTLAVLAGGVPVGAAAAYVGVQTLAGLLARLLAPDVKRSSLRTGQRYPAFAHPGPGAAAGGSFEAGAAGAGTGGTSADAGGGTSADAADGPRTADAAGAGATGDAEGAEAGETVEDVSHTRVFRPPEDSDLAPEDGGDEG